MKAFVERFCDHGGIVRSGPECDSFGKPYSFAVAYSVQGRQARIKGLVAGSTFSRPHARAIIKALALVGLEAVWERFRQ